MPSERIRDYRRENDLTFTRVAQTVALVIVLFVLLVGRLVYLQIIDHDAYATLSAENHVKAVAVPPKRGLILDRNGVLLAESRPAYSLEITPERVADMDATLAEIAALIPLGADDLADFQKTRARRPAFESIPLRPRLSDAEAAKIAVRLHLMTGVDIVPRLVRHYPHAEHAAHVVGYVGRISEDDLAQIDQSNYRGTHHIGKQGIEKHYEDQLHGSVGVQRVEINAAGRVLRKLESVTAEPGKDIHLTLDSKLQYIAERALGEEKGAVVAIEPASGEVLVFASRPGYDPNLFVDGIDHSLFQAYNQGEARPLYNRALYGRYPPGSTIKPFSALAGLESGVINPDFVAHCPGYFMLPDSTRRYRDWKKEGHGRVGVTRSIVESCDVFYYELAQLLGINRLHDYMRRFGFGKTTGIDLLPSADEVTGLFPSPQWKRRVHNELWLPGETLITTIGQGFTLVTPLQLAMATATLANRGKRMRPRLVREIHDTQSGETTRTETQTNGEVPKRVEAHWRQIIEAMRQVVHTPRGTAYRLDTLKYAIAGKTGTAQVIAIAQDEEYDEEKVLKKHRDHALFIAFAPVQNPRIALAVIVENGGSGGSVAAPIAGEIIRAWLAPEPPPLAAPAPAPDGAAADDSRAGA